MSKNRLRLLAVIVGSLALGSILLAACTRPGTSPVASTTPGSSNGGGGNTTVKMGLTTFEQTSITIPKGAMLTLEDTQAVPHIIQNGSWVNGTAKPAKETGAPTVDQSFSGNDTHQVGPFNTAGTFHLYCTIHSGMDLTVIVSNGSSSGSGNTGGNNGSTVKLGLTTFEQTSVTISKGSMLTLVDTQAVPHIIQNGSWVNGAAKPSKETGAPTVNQSFSGNDTHQIGPFNTAGTFHLYCTIHQGMNLTVIVTG
ncbi:MAG TPA: plastocyanin/azurin family copper-binding protein [Ktedonobacteraceae bacterium]|nr:plastocyanin/azurin family copper-binding protein [Ktedonobacteraceae bacterium]